MERLQKRIKLAKKELGKSVVSINPKIRRKIITLNEDITFFGVKDTKQIPELVIKRLEDNPKMIWLTVDKSSDKGRAIDTDLHNPITYRLMTGSTSGGPVNILKGINDVAIGTDGGGSVLAPAMSCQLPSVIGTGVGLYVNNEKLSTDGRKFVGSVGAIAKNVMTLKKVMECMIANSLNSDTETEIETLKIAIPKKGSIICPDQKDMGEKVMKYITKIDNSKYDIKELDMAGIDNRNHGIDLIRDIFESEQADVIVTHEGPIDLYGYGETIPQYFGKIGQEITKNHGKYLVRSANMSHTTAISIPTDELASGLVIIAKNGLENAIQAFQIAEQLENVIKLPNVWQRYFLTESQDDSMDFTKD